jgi:hypothetical protein
MVQEAAMPFCRHLTGAATQLPWSQKTRHRPQQPMRLPGSLCRSSMCFFGSSLPPLLFSLLFLLIFLIIAAIAH